MVSPEPPYGVPVTPVGISAWSGIEYRFQHSYGWGKKVFDYWSVSRSLGPVLAKCVVTRPVPFRAPVHIAPKVRSAFNFPDAATRIKLIGQIKLRANLYEGLDVFACEDADVTRWARRKTGQPHSLEIDFAASNVKLVHSSGCLWTTLKPNRVTPDGYNRRNASRSSCLRPSSGNGINLMTNPACNNSDLSKW